MSFIETIHVLGIFIRLSVKMSSAKSLLFMSLSDTTFKSNLSGADLIQKESQVMLRKGQWSTFIYVLDLASVIGKRIFCHYPDFGEAKVKLLFNKCIIPRSYYEGSSSSFEIFNVLFCQFVSLFWDCCQSIPIR